MAPAAEIAPRHFEALNAHDLNAAAGCWAPGAIDRFVGQQDVVGPERVREYLGALFSARARVPDPAFNLSTSRANAAATGLA